MTCKSRSFFYSNENLNCNAVAFNPAAQHIFGKDVFPALDRLRPGDRRRLARRLYDPQGRGVLLDAQADGIDPVLARSQALQAGNQAMFEAGFAADGALAFADILLPDPDGARWRMIEVKSSTEVKACHHDDAATQSFVARRAGVPLAGIALARIDSGWTCPGGGDERRAKVAYLYRCLS